jgi:hypothetical protein
MGRAHVNRDCTSYLFACGGLGCILPRVLLLWGKLEATKGLCDGIKALERRALGL